MKVYDHYFIVIVNDKIYVLNKKISNNEKEIAEINNKINDISIIDLFKNSSSEEGENPNSNNIIGLINNIDNKIRQKFKLNDEHFAKNDEDIFKLKADVNNMKNSQDSFTRSIKNNKEAIDDVLSQVSNLKSWLDELNNSLNKGKQNQIEVLKLLLENKMKEFEEKIDDKIFDRKLSLLPAVNQEKDDKSSVSTLINQQVHAVTIEEINKQIKDMKKQIYKLGSQTSLEGLLKDINIIKEELKQKCSVNQYKELSILSDELSKKLSIVRDQLSTQMDNSSGHESIRVIQKKLDLAMGMILQLQAAIEQKSQTTVQPIQHDTKYYSNYLEIEAFNDFKSILNEKLAYLSDNIAENRKFIEELFISIKQKTAYRDLKEMEELMLGRIEQLKQACQKKFADKVEMGKNLKFLDAQIKNIIEINIKRTDKGDSWLLAKKPLGGHLCASCENYIGDLKESNAYVPWNKYPIKDQNDKLYRLGNGFSKMLQMVGNETQEERREMKDAFSTSQECFSSLNTKKEIEKKKEKVERDKEVSTPQRERDQSLPRLKKNNESASIFSENENVQDNLNLTQDEEDNQNKPKM